MGTVVQLEGSGASGGGLFGKMKKDRGAQVQRAVCPIGV